MFRDKVQEDLKLTEDQKEKLEQYLKEWMPDAMQFFQKIDGLNGRIASSSSVPIDTRHAKKYNDPTAS